MKKLFILFIILYATNLSAQIINPSSTITQQDYRAKSKNQKTGAWLLAAGGGIIVLASVVSTAGVYLNGPRPSFPKVPAAIGAACIIGSVPLFIASSRNKEKAQKAPVY